MHFLKILRSLFLMIAVANTGAHAQVVFNSLEDAWKYADMHNVSIRNANYELDKVLYAKKASYMAFLPQVSANGSFTDNTAIQTTLIPGEIVGQPGRFVPVQFGQKYIYTAGLSAQIDVLNLQNWYNIAIAKETEQLNRASVANSKKITYQQIATQYYSYLLSREAARLAATSAAVADSALQSVTNKFKEGTVNEASLDLAHINKERAEQTMVSAQYQAQTSKNSLKALLDLSVTDSLSIESSLQANLNSEQPGAFQEDPAVKLAYFQSQVNLSTYHASNATILPTVSVLYSNTTQQYDNKFEPLQGGPAWFPARYWALRASWNIFSGGTRWVQSRKNLINYHESTMQFENMQKQSAINDENLKLSYQKAQDMLARSKRIMDLSYDNYVHISYRYDEGLSSLDDRLTAFTDYVTYQNQYLNNLSDMLAQLYLVKIRTIALK
jgi:outer membrane protein